eukprot:983364_1
MNMSTLHLLSHVDQETKQIVIGYIRNIEHHLLNQHDNDAFYHIPSAIILMCITYVHNCFLHHNSYKWTINRNNILDAVLDATVGTKFCSPTFVIGNLKWIVEIFPNGDKDKRKGSFIVNLKLFSLPPKWKHIIICRTMMFQPLNIKRTTIRLYKRGTSHGWRSKTLSFDEMKQYNFSNLTFIVTVKILKIITNKPLITNNIFYKAPVHIYHRKSSISWRIDSALLTHDAENDHKQDPLYNKCYQSQIFDEMWCLQFCPRATENCVYLQLCLLPGYIAKVQVQYTICFEGTDIKSTLVSMFDYTSSAFGWKIPKTKFVDLKDDVLDKMNRVAIVCDVVIVNAYDEEGSIITLAEMEWMKYKNQVTGGNSNQYKHLERLVNENTELKKRMHQMEAMIDEMQQNMNDLQLIQSTRNIWKENDEGRMNENGMKLKEWLKNTVQLEQYFDTLVENGFEDLSTLKHISSVKDLDEIGITKLGHKRKLFQCITIINGHPRDS